MIHINSERNIFNYHYHRSTQRNHLEMRGFFRRKRQIQDPLIKIWVKYFTSEIPRKDTQLSNFHELHSILSTITDREFTKQDINQESKLPEEQFFANLFGLEQIIIPNNPYDQLVLFLDDNFKTFIRNEKEVALVIPLIYRYLIHYMYQLPTLYTAAIEEDNQEIQSVLKNIQPLLHLFLKHPEIFSNSDEILQIISPLFKVIENYFINDFKRSNELTFINDFNSQILGLFLAYTHNSTATDVFLPIFHFYIQYYDFWVKKRGTSNFHYLQDCTYIPKAFINFPVNFAQKHYDDLISPMLQIGMNLLSFIYLHFDENNSDQDTFKLGMSFMNFLNFIAELGPDYAASVWNHQMFHFIVSFVIWTIDHFNFASFEITTVFDETEMKLISPDFQKSLPIIKPPIYEFITDKTFPSHLVINIHRAPLNDPDQLTQYAITGVHNMVNSQPNLKELMGILISFAKFNSADTYLSIFTDVSLRFALSYLNEKNYELFNPLSNRTLLSMEITFFTVQLLSNAPIETVSSALTKINGFKMLLSNYAFSPKHNMWTSSSNCEDLGFFCLIRNSIFKLLCKCFVHVPDDAPRVLRAVGEIFKNSSPQMADEANKLLSILFKSNSSDFLKAMAETELPEIIVDYQMRLQSMQLKLIEDEIDEKFVGYVGQSRVQILHLIDLFLLHDQTRCFLFCSMTFVQMLFHLLFEPMVQEFVLHLIKRGMQLDSGAFDKRMVRTPFDNLFPNIRDLFKEALKHRDNDQWIKLIQIFLEMMSQTLMINRQSLLDHLNKFNFMEDASQLPSIATELDPHIEIVNNVLKCFIPILQANFETQKRAAQFPMTTICKEISGLPFGEQTINLLLNMIFEQPIYLSNLPKQAEIHNQKMLPFLHESTKHLEEHPKIFQFIAHICTPSVTNKLKVFRSKMPITILKYIQSFPRQEEITSSQQNSINALLTLFMTVSSFVFQWKTFFESIRCMRPINQHYRAWWTSLLISCFTNILSSITHKSPSSFFHFDGRHTGIVLPTISCSNFSNGLSFMVRFELGVVWALPYTKPRLLSLVTSYKQRLELYFQEDKIVFEYQRNDKAQPYTFQPNYVFKKNHWYHLVVTLDNSTLAFYINGMNIGQFALKRGLKLDGIIDNGRIANIAPSDLSMSKIASSEMPLIFNMSCVYMFSSALSPETIQLMSLLPIDFVYSFSPLPSNMNSEIPDQCSSLFTDSNNSNLVFCYNARMTVDNTCANLARTDVANATVRAHIIPFSTSFCDVTSNIGGLKTFLPLFTQVDLPIETQENNDSQNFLLALIGLFTRFCSSSSMIQSEFINYDGIKCLADLLSKIQPSTFQKKIINQLIEFYNVLNCDDFKMIMAKDFWFNHSLWKHTTPNIQKYVISQYIPKIFSNSRNLMIKATSVRSFLLLIYDEENIEIRSEMWNFIMELAKLKFNIRDQELFFKFAFIESRGVVLHLEVLSHMYQLMSDKVSNFHKIVENHGFFNEFIPLFESPTEQVRIYALKFLVMLHKHVADSEIAEPPHTIDVYFLNSIPVFNPHELTPALWKDLLQFYFVNYGLQSSILPFISHLSIFYEAEFVRSFLIDLNKSLVLYDSVDCESIPQCILWFLWLFHCMGQANRPVVKFGEDEVMVEIFAKVCATVLWNSNDFGDIFTFLLSLQIIRKWDTTLFLRKILCKTLTFLLEVTNETICLSALSEVFNYLFYISSTEPFYMNVQLDNLHNRKFVQTLEDSMPGNKSLQSLLEVFNQPIQSLSFHFSSRILPNGEWLDAEVALSLARLITRSKLSSDVTITFNEGKWKVSELFSFILAFIIRSNESMFDESLKLFNSFFDKSNLGSDMSTSIHLFSSAFYRVAIKNPERRDLFILFLQKYRSFFPRSTSIVIEKSDIFLKQFTIEFNESVRDIVANYHSLLNEKSSIVTKQTKIRLENLWQRVNERNSILKAPKTNTSFLSQFEEEHLLFTQEVQRQKVLCAKANKRIMRDLSSNGGPWCISGSAEHWKLWQICDEKYRRLYMKPNLKFDQHKHASLLRDESTVGSANAKYEQWLNSQGYQPCDSKQGERKRSKSRDGQGMFDDDDDLNDEDGNGNENNSENTTTSKSYSFSTEAQLITITKSMPYDGTFFMNNDEICFNGNEKSVQFLLNDLEMVLKRSYLHIDYGLEFFLSTKKSYFVYFSKGNRSNVLRLLKSCSNIKVLQTGPGRDVIQPFTEKWKSGMISNYEYLIYLNLIGGRSYNDLSQYPVFPWILSNYTSNEIDLTDPKNYRDLSKPIGALNEQRLKKLIYDYEQCPDSPYKCLYRVHYSNPFYVSHYLSRIEPFTTSHIEMQGGKFDKANRMFRSIGLSYEAVTSLNSDFRELIPEFFTLPDFLINADHFDLGTDEGTGQIVDDVILPPWAKSAEDFIRIHRQALESEYVSEHLPDWIDLIFGCNQTGQNAIKHYNTFHTYCYQSSMTRDVMSDPETLHMIQNHISTVGIIPNQLFTMQHPKRQYIAPVIRKVFDENIKVIHKLYNLSGKIRFSTFSGTLMYFLTGDLKFCSLQIPKMFKNSQQNQQPVLQQIGSIDKFLIVPSNSSVLTPSKSFAFLRTGNGSGYFVSSSVWDNSFHVFKVDQTSLTHVFPGRQKYSLIANVASAGAPFLLTSWRDSSLTLWNVRLSDQSMPLYRVTPHLTSLVDIDANPVLRLIASLDKSRKLILSYLPTGRYIRGFDVIGNDKLNKLMLLTNGYIVVASEPETSDRTSIKTIVRVFGINTRLLADIEIDDQMLIWCRAEFDSGFDGIGIILKNKLFVFLEIPTLKIIFKCKLPLKPIVALHCIPQCLVFILIDADGNVFYIDLE